MVVDNIIKLKAQKLPNFDARKLLFAVNLWNIKIDCPTKTKIKPAIIWYALSRYSYWEIKLNKNSLRKLVLYLIFLEINNLQVRYSENDQRLKL